MALGQRELWLTLRVRNEATNALRAAARGMRGLDFTGAQARADITAQRSRILGQARMAELRQADYLAQERSFRTGQKALSLEKQFSDLAISRKRAVQQRLSLEAQDLNLQSRLINARQAHAKAEQAITSFRTGGPRTVGVSGAMLEERALAAKLQVESLTKAQLTNAEAMKVQRAAANQLTLAERQLLAQQAENARMAEKNAALAKEQSVTAGRFRTQSRQLLQQLRAVPTQDWAGLGHAISGVGRTLTTVGGIATITLGIMAKQAADVSRQMTLAATQARPAGAGPAVTRQISGQLFDNVLKQMQRFPASAQDMSQSLYEIFSGTNVQNIGKATDMLKTFNMMAIAGGSDLKTMTDAGISMYNNFPGQFKNMTDAANQFFSVVRFGRMNADQFAKSLSYILPIAKTAGMSFMDVGSAMAFLTRQTGAIRTTQDAMGLARLIQLMGRKDMVDGMQKLGVAVFDASGKMRPMIDIITELRSKTNMTNKEVLNFFKTTTALGSGKAGTQGTIQALRVFSQIYEHVRAANKVAQQTRQDTDEMIKSFQAMSRDPGVRWAVFTNQLRALGLTIGRDLIPTFAKIGAGVGKVVAAFERLSPRTKTIIADFLAYGGLATLVVGFFTLIAGSALRMIGVWGRVGAGLKTVRVAMKGVEAEEVVLAAETGAIAPELIAVGVALTLGIPLFLKYHDQILKVSNVIRPLKNLLENSFPVKALLVLLHLADDVYKLGRAFVNFWNALKDSKKNLNDAGGHFQTFGKVLHGVKTAIDSVTKAWRFIEHLKPVNLVLKVTGIDKIPGAGKAKGILGQIFSVVQDPIGAAFAGAEKGIKAGTDRLNKAAKKMRDDIRKAPHDLPLGPGAFPSTRDAERGLQRTQRTIRNAGMTTDQLFMKLRRLQAQFAVAPTLGLAKQIDTLTTKFSKLPKATQDYYNQLGQNLGAVKIVSDQAALSMGRNVDKLRKAFERAPSIRAYQAWFQANKRYTTLATQDQQQFATDMVSAHQQALEKIKAAHKAAADTIKQNWQNVLQQIRSMYNDIHQALVTAFGTLGSGPLVTSLNAQVQRIRDAGTKSAQALRDQAQKIQDGAKDAEKNISATEGNLIDWGLMLDPSKMKTNTDAAVKALNDRADAIEKAANARADRLQKRLDQHKLTPRELIQDLRKQVKAFTDWNSHLERLRRRGAPEALIKQLRDLGPEFDNMLKGIMRMSPQQFRQYIALFNRGQRAINRETMRQLREQLKVYRKFGANIAQAIAAGIQDESPALRNAFVQLIRETFPGLRVPGGVARQARRTQRRRAPIRGHQTTVHHRRQVVHHETNTYHYHADRSHHMSYEQWLRKQHFLHRNQRRC